MLKCVTIALLSLALFTSCDNDVDRADEVTTEETIDWPQNGVPASIQASFAEQYPEATEVEWDVDDDHYEVEFKIRGDKREIEYSFDGMKIDFEG